VLRCFHETVFVPLLLHGRVLVGLRLEHHGLDCEGLLAKVVLDRFVVSHTQSFVSFCQGNALTPGSDSFVKSRIVFVSETNPRELLPAELFLEECGDGARVGCKILSPLLKRFKVLLRLDKHVFSLTAAL